MADGLPLTVEATRAVIRRLGELTDRIVLVGGQAIASWVDYYRDRDPVAKLGPVYSKDIDFCGTPDEVKLCAEKLGGRSKVPEPFSHTPNTGVVEFIDTDGITRVIDFLGHPFGLDYDDVIKKAVRVVLLDEYKQPTGLHMLVMHPMHCLESRVHNVAQLPGYDTPHGLAQLSASIVCLREYLRDRLIAGAIRAVLNYNEAIFRLAANDRDALGIVEKHSIDPFEAVLVDDGLPGLFLTVRLPQMREQLSARRRRSTTTPL